MKIHDVEQKSSEWFNIRRDVFTASEFGPWCLDPCPVSMTVDDIKKELDACSIDRKGITKRDDLIPLLPDPDRFRKLTQGAQTAIIKKLVDALPKDAWQIEMDDKAERAMEYNIPVQRGNALEPLAREWYSKHTGTKVTEVGFITHDDGGIGCSPDGLIYCETPVEHGGNIKVVDHVLTHGLEIKCPMPEKHLAYLLDGTLPDEYKWQVHGSMVVTGIKRWDFLSYCPGHAPILVTVEWDDFTAQLAAGLKQVVNERAKMKAKLRDLWDDFNGRDEAQ